MPEQPPEPHRPRPPLLRPDPARARLFVQTWSPGDRRGRQLLALNDLVVGAYTHFLPGEFKRDDRTMPCFRELRTCSHCGLVKNRRWKGFLGAQLEGGKKPVILEVTEAAWEECEDLRRLDGQLRGWAWSASREKDGRRSRMILRKMLTLHAAPKLPCVDVLSVLSRMWLCDRAELVALTGTDEGAGGWGDPSSTESRHANGATDLPPAQSEQPAPKGEWQRLRAAQGGVRRDRGH